MAPRLSALNGRCGTFGASGWICVQVRYFRAFVDVSGALAMEWGCCAAAFCVAFGASGSICVQVWFFRAFVDVSGALAMDWGLSGLCRCQRSLGDGLGLSCRGFLRGMCGTFGTSAEPWRRTRTVVVPWLSAWQAWHFWRLRFELCGRCVSFRTFMYVCLSVYLFVCMYYCMHVCFMYVCLSICLYVCRFVCMYVCMYFCTYFCMSVCMYVWHSMDGFTSLCLITPVFQIVSEIHSNITSNTDKIQGTHFHNHFPTLSFTRSFPFPLSFPVFLHIPFLNFAFCPNSVSEGNWEHARSSGPFILLCYIFKNDVFTERVTGSTPFHPLAS